jgi:hypothetical protein
MYFHGYQASYQVFRAPTASLPRAPSLTFLGILTFVDSTHELLRGRIAPNCSLCPTITQKSAHRLILGTKKLIAFALMSHSHLAASSSSSFQLIINNALKAYEKRTKNDLLAHPLAAQIQACDSLTAILTVLQQQIQGLDQPRSDDRWTKWLDPTVNVLFAFSATLGAGVSLVSPRLYGYLKSGLSYLLGRHSPLLMRSLRESAFFFQCVSSITRHRSFLHIDFSDS